MAIMTHAKFHFNWLMLTSIFGIWASEPPTRAWRTTEKAGPDRVKQRPLFLEIYHQLIIMYKPVKRKIKISEYESGVFRKGG